MNVTADARTATRFWLNTLPLSWLKLAKPATLAGPQRYGFWGEFGNAGFEVLFYIGNSNQYYPQP